jgi:hypothetical protein
MVDIASQIETKPLSTYSLSRGRVCESMRLVEYFTFPATNFLEYVEINTVSEPGGSKLSLHAKMLSTWALWCCSHKSRFAYW